MVDLSNGKLGFIGAGNMAGAIINGVVKTGLLAPKQIGICDIDPEKTEPYRQHGHTVYSGISELVRDCSRIVLSVKPQNFTQVLPQVAEAMTPDKLLISIAAGITGKAIQEAVGFACKVVLVMPNTPLLLGQGASALARVEPTTEEEFAQVRALFDAAGVTGEVAPDRMNQVIPVNGSSPAFLYAFAKVIVDCAEQNGIDSQTAMELFCQTMMGSAHMLLESGKTPRELIDMVCSPGGTTLAAMRALEDGGFSKSLKAAVEACIQRAEELSATE